MYNILFPRQYSSWSLRRNRASYFGPPFFRFLEHRLFDTELVLLGYMLSFSHSNHRDSWTVVTTTNCGVHHGRAVVDATWWWLGFSWQFMWFRQSKPRPAHGVHQSIASVYPTRSYPKQWIRLSKPPLPKGVCLILSYLVPFQLWSFAYIRGSMHMNMVGLHVWL